MRRQRQTDSTTHYTADGPAVSTDVRRVCSTSHPLLFLFPEDQSVVLKAGKEVDKVNKELLNVVVEAHRFL